MFLLLYLLAVAAGTTAFYSVREARTMGVSYTDFWRIWWAEFKHGAGR
jgi:hypothetical protein